MRINSSGGMFFDFQLNMKKGVLFLMFFLSVLGSWAQSDSTKPKPKRVNLDSIEVVRMIIDSVSHDTFFVYEFEEVALMDFATKEQRDAYLRLVYNVKKVLPYAKLAAFRLQMMEDNLYLLSDDKAKDKYIKETESGIKDEFMETMKNFSRSQGLLLIKLIHRESGKNTYEILRGYRGSVETFYWSAFAKLYNADLKSEYDPILDYQIEMIIDKYHME